ncbi:putative C2H2 finger domain-containing protein [Rosellinia necatrix]|uniref:Putative C2H2 finger domain-containing protein n=1 Tax=Rosellinia necatrix TaxID=77044 RepID=A0A1W2TK14_ROSNE|nr:putative C2H2 finger domain-containing protein [Rosellinia necatrix]
MEIPSRYSPREPGGPPAIYIQEMGRLDGPSRFGRPPPQGSSFSPSSIPMSIPNNRRIAEDDAPPPLPPPRFVPGVGPPGPQTHDRFPSIDSNASWEGSMRDSGGDHLQFRKQDVRRPQRDEGYHSMASTLSSLGSQDSFAKNLFMSHNQFQLNKSAGSDYDSHLKKKLDSRRVFDNRSPPRRSGLSMSLNQNQSEPRHPSLVPLSLPLRVNNQFSADSPRHPTDPSLQASTATSPGAMSYGRPNGPEYRSPVESVDVERSPLYRARRNNSDDATMSTHSGYDNTEDADFPMEETSGIRRLHIDDSQGRVDYHAIGQKRRASSPPAGESPPQGPLGSNDPTRRRDVGRGSPAPRLTLVPPSSLSSASSAGRSGSYVSTASLNTSISSLNSFGGRSPSGLSSGGLSPVDMMANSPYSTPISLAHPSCALFGRGPHQRNVSSESRQLASPRKVVEVPKVTMSKLQGGFFMCECCPKKPKKFETEEELRVHEAEKQYECSFCGNRFKNKNEAERHQNSLHVRRHSWSCSALLISGFDRAFHESTNRPGEADTCGYCGEEFGRSGGGGRARHATQRDWDLRLKHLQEVHKFRECNSSKKFYRADHFRQHLKHSHAGTSGKWTNMLENACMLEEEPPQPSR